MLFVGVSLRAMGPRKSIVRKLTPTRYRPYRIPEDAEPNAVIIRV